MLARCPPGKHKIQIIYPAYGSAINVTCDLTVEDDKER